MRPEFVFRILNDRHNQFINLVSSCPESKRNVIPDGFKNSIHWHLGHVLFSTQFHVFGLSETTEALVLPEEYSGFFAYGTKPSDWQQEPPAWEVLIAQLKAQPGQIQEWLKDKLDVRVKENFLNAKTYGELVVSTTLHAAEHAGNVSAMLKRLN